MTLRIHGEGIGNVHLTLSCDAQACLFSQTFTQTDYIAQRSYATSIGWLERMTAQGRDFLCPACSGKYKAIATHGEPDDD